MSPDAFLRNTWTDILGTGGRFPPEHMDTFPGIGTMIDGIGVDTASVILSELGLDFSMFPDESHFVSYLRLAPNLSISAGKKVPWSGGRC